MNMKSSRGLLSKSATGSSRLIKNSDKSSVADKDTRLKRKSDQLKDKGGILKTRMVSWRCFLAVISLMYDLLWF